MFTNNSFRLALLIKLLIHYTKGTILIIYLLIYKSVLPLFTPAPVSISPFLYSTRSL